MNDYCAICEGDVCKHGLCLDRGTPWSDGCPGSLGKDGYDCQNCAEAAYDLWLSDFYGGSTPQTDRERQEVAYREFKR